MTKSELIEKILFEVRQKGIALVSDSFIDFDDNDEVYTPDIDYEGAVEIINDILVELLPEYEQD